MNLDVNLDEVFREEEFMAAETQWPTLRLIPQDDTLSDTKRHGTVNVSLYVIQQTPFNIDQDCSIHVGYPSYFSNERRKSYRFIPANHGQTDTKYLFIKLDWNLCLQAKLTLLTSVQKKKLFVEFAKKESEKIILLRVTFFTVLCSKLLIMYVYLTESKDKTWRSGDRQQVEETTFQVQPVLGGSEPAQIVLWLHFIHFQGKTSC